MQKKAKIILTAALMLAIAVILIKPSAVYADDIQDIEQLISRGVALTDGSSSEAYVWVSDVANYIAKYENSKVYSYIIKYCGYAKSNYLTYDGAQNKILGALLYLKVCLNNEPKKSPLELAGEGASLNDGSSPEAYKWAFDVSDVAEQNPDSSVYADLVKYCGYVKSNYLTYDNAKNKIIADLSILDNEIAVSSTFVEIVIVKSPNKTDYVEGEYFDPAGVEINAIFNNVYKDGSNKSISKQVTDYVVDTTTKLKTSNTKWTFSYTVDGITKSVSQDIDVAKFVPELVSNTLDSISVASNPKKTTYLIGELFNPKGLKVNAKYKNVWSDGSTSYTTTKNVEYTVDDVTPLTKGTKKWTVSYYDNGVTAKATIKIKVKSSDPVISDTKLTITPGDIYQLRVFGTSKYVMWKCDKNDIIYLGDDGTIRALTPGSVTVTATIGSGKKNVKLTCTVKVSPKVSANKTVIFLNNDEYETLKLKAAKNVSYRVSSDSYIKLVDEGNGVYEVIPNGNYLFGNCNSSITVTSYGEDGRSYIEQKIPVFIYGDAKSKTVTLNTSVNYKSDKSFSNAEFFFDGNRNGMIYDEKVYKQLKKKAKKTNKSYAFLDIEISKENFEKIMTKAIKAKTITIYGITN
jgi:hypothetical protein